jgi:hypothetical protein
MVLMTLDSRLIALIANREDRLVTEIAPYDRGLS